MLLVFWAERRLLNSAFQVSRGAAFGPNPDEALLRLCRKGRTARALVVGSFCLSILVEHLKPISKAWVLVRQVWGVS